MDEIKLLRSKALYFLAKREYSVSELSQKLTKYTENLANIKLIIDEMLANRFLNEERFAENFTHSKSKKYGSLKVRYLLQNKLSNKELINDVLQEAKDNDLELAKRLWERRFGCVADNIKDKAKQVRFLQSRGIPMNIVIQVIAGIEEID